MIKTKPIKVLIIDDDEAFTDMIKIVLEPEGFIVSIALSGPEGIESAQQTNQDVVILDLFMPEIDGWQVCKAIRSFSQVPILILSVVSKPGLVARALDEGADDYMLKPVPSNVLIAHLKKLVRRARAEQNNTNKNSKLNSIYSKSKSTDHTSH